MPGGSGPSLCVAVVCRGTCKKGQSWSSGNTFRSRQAVPTEFCFTRPAGNNQKNLGQVLSIMSQPQKYLNIELRLSALVHNRNTWMPRTHLEGDIFKNSQTRLRITSIVSTWGKMKGAGEEQKPNFSNKTPIPTMNLLRVCQIGQIVSVLFF